MYQTSIQILELLSNLCALGLDKIRSLGHRNIQTQSTCQRTG